MKEKPNFNKTELKKIYQKKEYIIYKVNGKYYAIENINKYQTTNIYIKKFSKARSLIDLALRSKLPNTPRRWEIRILIKISNDKEYIRNLKKLLEEL